MTPVLNLVSLVLLIFFPSNLSLSINSSSRHGISRRDAIGSLTTTTAGIMIPSSFINSRAVAAEDPLVSSSSSMAVANVVPSSGIVPLPGTSIDFPLASFGLQIYSDSVAYERTMLALEAGFRNFFASVLAGNQRGFARAIRDSGIPRNQLFISGSVVSNRATGFDAAYQKTTIGWQQNMDKFSSAGNIDYLDQILLDYPGPDCASICGQWKAFQEMHQQKLTKTLSVSNFSPLQLDCILKDSQTQIPPVLNQMPYSVAYHRSSITEHDQRNILLQAWAPLGNSLGGRFNGSIRSQCATIGKSYSKSWAQVALRWIVQSGAAFTTESSNRDHMKQDLDIFDFTLSEEEMKLLSSLAT
jgi:diketogulonate reductase-like aldo/keto reductase